MHDRARALKRGGGREIISFDQHLPEAEAAMFATAHLDDVSCYDVMWAANVVTRAWKHLHDSLVAEDKGQWLEQLKPFITGGTTAPPDQGEVAARFGVPIATFRTWLSRLRERYRESLRMEVASTVSDPADVDDELGYLYRILTS